MRALGIDYGTVKVGLALSDELKMLATPYKVVPSNAALADEIARVVQENNVDTIVMGMPYYDGAETQTTAKVRAFTERLRTMVAVPIFFWDESFSTQDARVARIELGVSRKKRAGHQDALAAVVILQSYLESKRSSAVE